MKQKSLSIVKGTWALIRFRPAFFALNMIGGIIFLTSRLIPGWLEKRFYDALTLPVDPAPAASSLLPLLALIFVVELGRTVSEMLGGWGGAEVRNAGGSLMRLNLTRNVLRKPGAMSLPVSTGDAVNRLDDDLADFADFPTWLPEISGHFLFTVFALVILFQIAPLITAVALLPLVAVFFLNRLAFQRFLQYGHEMQAASSKVTGFLGELFRSVQAVKVADASQGAMGYFRILNDARRHATVRRRTFWAMHVAVSDNLGDISVAVMVVLAGLAMAQGDFTVGDFVLFSSYLFFVARFPSEIGSYLAEIAQQRVVLDRMQALQPDAPPESLVARASLEQPPVVVQPVRTARDHLRHVQIRGLTFRYGSGGGISDIDLDLPRGSFTVITGRVGSGKTTLLRTLLGLLPAQQGEIHWNGELVHQPASFFVPPRSAYLPQTPRLFSDSLRENILLGLPEDDALVARAVKAAVLEPDVARLEQGLDTIVGPRGVRLSGGQVQRAAAARMLIREPELLVMDDLSSALDVETEQLLWRHLVDGGDGRTYLVVSHRPAALERADQIIVLEEGRVATRGRLSELPVGMPALQSD